MTFANTEISKEINQYGSNWGKLHYGYFSDIQAAAPFIEKIKAAIAVSEPQVLADLAGGTGFILSELIKHNIPSSIRLINLDLSDIQLQETENSRITAIRRSLSDFKRGDIDDESKRFCFIMRSALHYFGKDGFVPVLQHLREQMKEGEFFVHQNACFENKKDADYINKIYEIMGTGKWYPTVNKLSSLLQSAGWAIKSTDAAPNLILTCEDLAKRYNLSEKTVLRIKEISKRFGKTGEDGFCGYLQFKIFTCAAV